MKHWIFKLALVWLFVFAYGELGFPSENARNKNVKVKNLGVRPSTPLNIKKPKAVQSKVGPKVTCTDSAGHSIRQGESGFQSCAADLIKREQVPSAIGARSDGGVVQSGMNPGRGVEIKVGN